MTKVRRQYVGTEDLMGATVVRVGWDDIELLRDGRTFILEIEKDYGYNSMCECDHSCSCNDPSVDFRVKEVV